MVLTTRKGSKGKAITFKTVVHHCGYKIKTLKGRSLRITKRKRCGIRAHELAGKFREKH